MLDKCFMGNKIAFLWHTCLPSLGTCAKGVQFCCPSRTYPAIPYCCYGITYVVVTIASNSNA